MANLRLCSIPECGKPHKGRGYCQAHLVRLKKTGSVRAEIPIKEMGKTEKFIISVSSIEYTDRCITWPYATDPMGRGIGTYKSRTILASRAVCTEAHGDPPSESHEAAHNCGNADIGCVNPHHLRWKTHTENEADKLAHGTSLNGERMSNHVLTDADCEEIRSLRGKMPQTEIAAIYGVSQQHISAVQTGRFRSEKTRLATMAPR